MSRGPVFDLDEAIERSIQEQAENQWRPSKISALTQEIERSRQGQTNNPEHHRSLTSHAAASAESHTESDSDDSGLEIKGISSKRPGGRPRPNVPRQRRRPNDDGSNPQATRENTPHAERPRLQRNEETPSQRPARSPTPDLFFEGQIQDQPAAPQKPQAVRVKPPPQGEKSPLQPHDDPRAQRPARISIPDILNRGTTTPQKPQPTHRAPKPAPKPQPKEPEPDDFQNHQRPARLAIPNLLNCGFPTPPRPTQATQRETATAQGTRPAEEEEEGPDESPSQRRARRRRTPTPFADNWTAPSESDDDIFDFEDDDKGGMGNK